MDALVIPPVWPTAHWYPQLQELAVQRPVLLPQWHTLLTLPQEYVRHPSQGCNASSRVACIRRSLEVRGISQRAASCVLKSWLAGTEKQYSAARRYFCCWRKKRQANPLQADLGAVWYFLTDQLEVLNKSYSTINWYRSALSVLCCCL